ncbi:efflux RND transporter permease subunit [Roseibium denhamense]|uniref:Multidrug efflux pump n=1 Tax=Roseibium denhamense TaxID=76305 RepID=A0ABY1NC09_9HYPH|nr:efflux RND transporter permease subunit [Roseibium denhamense]MTI06610.1 efflux RND transporter permease subunit [Roseibium denhamense]SMP05688.1 multidrug efflux pump [Roseibium denhamense]
MLSDLAIRRPVLAAVASLLIIVFGIGVLNSLPVRELPDIDTAVVTITTTYRGAAPEVIDTDITEIIEGSVAGVAGVKTISSSSRRGRSRVVVEFEVGNDIDAAANDVRDAVARVRADLPTDTDEPQVVKNDADSDPVMRLAVTSDRLSAAEITDYVDRYIIDRLATVPGVASIDTYGGRPKAVRIWLDRRAMAARNLTVLDIEQALRRANIELPAGELKSDARQLSVRLDSRLPTVDAFADVVIDRVAGYPIRIKDVATVVAGVAEDDTIVRSNGRTAVGMAVIRQSQSNTIAISEAVRAEIADLEPNLPADMQIEVGSDDAIFVGASIREVLTALFLSLGLVVLVILVFLRSFRATLIPAITIPIALIGTFAAIAALGFSLNVLTLLALLLAIGLVVDDAIVVLENIQRRIDRGESPLMASFLGTCQVTFAVLATSMTLIAVFVPLSFLQGQVGRLFVEFGFVMASAVVISTFVALTACPALASRVLTPSSGSASGLDGNTGDVPENWFLRGFRSAVTLAVRMPLVVIALAVTVAALGAMVYQQLPRELTPSEDRGVVFVPLSAPQGSTVTFTDQAARQVERISEPLIESGDVKTVFTFTGSWGRPHRGFIVLRLADWDDRDRSHRDVVRAMIPNMGNITVARGFPITPAGLGLRGSRTPLRIVVSGPDFDSVKEWAAILLERGQENPNLRNLEMDYEENQPQLDIQLDRERADDLGISVETIATTMQTLLASREVTTFLERGREYPVLVQASSEDRASPSDIEFIFLRADDGETLVPLSALVSLEVKAAPAELRRFDRLPSITIEGAVAEGYSLGDAITYMEDAVAELLPAEARISLAGQSQQFRETSSGAGFTFALALLIVFLVLAAQFESFVHPLVIMLTVPLGVAGAVFALAASGLSLNIYSQIGIILLVGLMAKNGILIVEFANQLRDEGKAVTQSAIDAAVLRLRPIVMTVISTILGAMPLVLASGAGAESRTAIGTVIVGGLLLSGILTLFLTPVLYSLLARFTKPRSAIERRLDAELGNRPASADAPPAE